MREAVSRLSADEAAMLLEKLGASLQRRKYQLIGYLVAAIVGLFGFVLAMIVYATHEPGTFVGWVFLIPFGGIGLALFIFGRVAERAGRAGLSATAAGSLTSPSRSGSSSER